MSDAESQQEYRILAWETTGRQASVAALSANVPLICRHTPPNQRTAQSLIPTVASILSELGWTPSSVDLLAICHGPGSFTGLRIGVTAVKTFAYAAGCQVIGLNTLEVLAYQWAVGTDLPDGTIIQSVMKSERQQLFVASYRFESPGRICNCCETQMVSAEQWLASLTAVTHVTGPALEELRGHIDEAQGHITVAPNGLWFPQAVTVGQLGLQRHRSGDRHDPWQLVPHYYRRSSPEEKLR
ncbi:MAG: tRNA (adenosine(37)-N6)-threonylcarbamoyltransferase complex dimerization subunit type 1 TsaB [Pirellulaceae bacterium]|nr:tRNA (adenosine(37)-N6)-threonylcarbamoyltransferase complex dimerization subunit type 1 TsaB [Planctomycetales bacterium]